MTRSPRRSAIYDEAFTAVEATLFRRTKKKKKKEGDGRTIPGGRRS